MYSGGLIACIGSAIVVGGLHLSFDLPRSAFPLVRAGAEDKLMAQQFPKEYPDYKRRTKALIPFVW